MKLKKLAVLALASALLVSGCGTGSSKDSKKDSSENKKTASYIEGVENSYLSVTGFAAGKVNDRSQYKEGDTEYRVVNNETEFVQAIADSWGKDANTGGTVKVIEIRADLNLGWNELPEEAKNINSEVIYAYPNSLKNAGKPWTNPVLIESGVSRLELKYANGLTIFSTNGSTIKHAELKINECNDVVIRNLNFREMWEWDDALTNTGDIGDDKRLGWAFMKINTCHNIWIDHCSFGIAYDGLLDVENGTDGVTVSWCNFGETDLSENSYVYKTMAYMEELYQQGKGYSAYSFLRDQGATMEEIMHIANTHHKVHLIGSGDKDTDTNPDLEFTMAYSSYTNMLARLPRIRMGNCHAYNCYFNNTPYREGVQTIIQNHPGIKEAVQNEKYSLLGGSSAMGTTNGGAIQYDNCVLEGIESAIISNHKDHSDQYYTGKYQVNNSSYTLDDYTFTGSSDDKDTPFVTSSGVDIIPFSWNFENGKLPYEFKLLPLEDTKQIVTDYSGCGILEFTPQQWLQVEYK